MEWQLVTRAAECRRGKARRSRGSLALLCLAAAFLAPATARAQNLTYSEVKLGVLGHDVGFLKGKEGGVDLNPEIIWQSPVSDAWAATVPDYLRWAVQPRPTIGGEINTSGFTDQAYVGATWTWQLAGNVLQPGDGIVLSYFFGPSFNDGEVKATAPNRKSLGSFVLFREALELGYQITPVYEISALLDHVSNGGLAKQNQSINDFGARFGIRF
ncbi:MAG TPA: acyloxyacyl hydrolase [Stellaceae bacterium]|nr:acyloxyacyl hydrolase [Stellaceae bacterium]